MADNDSRMGTSYLRPEILEYLVQTHSPNSAALQQAFDAPGQNDMPAIMVGPSEGKLLQLLLKLVGAKKVVEIGTLAGYSAIWMAEALPEDGHLWTIEYEPKNAEVAQRNLNAAKLSTKVSVHVGAGLDILPRLEAYGPFDAVFIDADKVNYHHYGRWAAKHTRPGGLLLGDNALLFGELLDDSERGHAMRSFHEEARAFYDTVCITNPDGLLVGVRR
jgi:caffeoyl-CoA O-methyltransferase